MPLYFKGLNVVVTFIRQCLPEFFDRLYQSVSNVVVTCEIKLSSNFEIISKYFYFTSNHGIAEDYVAFAIRLCI